MALLEVQDLRVSFPTRLGPVRACDGVSLDVDPGEVVGVVGESGSGKSVAALSVLGLVPSLGVIEAGSVTFDGVELIGAPRARLRALRGRQIGMFQDPGRALDPVHTVTDAPSAATSTPDPRNQRAHGHLPATGRSH